MWPESPEEGTFEYYYAMASEELWEYANPWGDGPSKKQIRDRAAQLALQDDDVDYEEYKQAVAHESWYEDVSETDAILAIRLRREEDSNDTTKLTEATQVLATVYSQSQGLVGQKNLLLQERNQSKANFLNELKKEVVSQVWDNRGHVFFSHKKKTPDGISRLRRLLVNYNNTTSTAMEIENVFQNVRDIIVEKQSVGCCFFNWIKSVFMKRHDLTSEFYDQCAINLNR
jgi:hypothetical protein